MTETVRKLATIRRIDALDPIPGADAIEVATISGWKVVVKKGEFEYNDPCVYFEIDSYLPIDDRYEFLRKGSSYYKNVEGLGEGFRLRTIKLRGQVSQGLALPMSQFPELEDVQLWDEHLPIDVTEALRVQKYEKPIPAQLRGQIRGNFPSFLRKTDQERVQNLVGELEPGWYEATLKLDGSSMTAYYNAGDFGVCSRNLDLKETEDNAYWRAARDHGLEAKLAKIFEVTGKSYALQGELMGPGVQGNRENFARLEFFVFDVWDIDEQEYLDPTSRLQFCGEHGFNHVPVYWNLYKIEDFNDQQTVEDLLEEVQTLPSINHPIAEGIVFKHHDKDYSFKVISNKFLLDGND